jgi:nicotinamidase/pyrazinamidase
VEDYGPRTALIVTDIQNDFADPAGSLYVQGGEDVVAFVDAEIGRAVAAGAAVFYTQDWHPPDTPHFAKDGGIWPVHCVRDTWGAQIHPGLRVDGHVVRKGTHGEDGYSGFSMRHQSTGEIVATELDELLRAHDVEHLVITGLATDYCVLATGLDALARGYRTTVLEDGVRAVDLEPGDGRRALERLRNAGAEVVAMTATVSGGSATASDGH